MFVQIEHTLIYVMLHKTIKLIYLCGTYLGSNFVGKLLTITHGTLTNDYKTH